MANGRIVVASQVFSMCQKVTNKETVVRTQNTQNEQVHVYLIHQQKI